MPAIQITKENFQKTVMESSAPVLLDFWASWCGPCKMVSPIIDEIADEYPQYTVGKVNVDEEKELSESFNVLSIPSLFIIKDGEIVNSSAGAKSKHQILAMFE